MSNKDLHRILVVDDEATTRRLFSAAALAEAMECDTAINGEEAMRRLEENEYDAVVTDLRMPVLNGHALAVSLLEAATRPLIIAVTAVEEPELVKDLMLRGIDDIVFKPLDYSLFAAKLSAMLTRRKRLATSGTNHD